MKSFKLPLSELLNIKVNVSDVNVAGYTSKEWNPKM